LEKRISHSSRTAIPIRYEVIVKYGHTSTIFFIKKKLLSIFSLLRKNKKHIFSNGEGTILCFFLF